MLTPSGTKPRRRHAISGGTTVYRLMNMENKLRSKVRHAAGVLLSFLAGSALAGASPDQQVFANPPEVRSVKGVLRTKFVLQPTELTFNGRKVQSNTYNGLYAPPTLRVKPGDTLELEFENRCPQPSNIHFHGLTVSPMNNSDNIFIVIYKILKSYFYKL